MVSKKVILKNPLGLHLRPAGVLCKKALEYESKITLTHDQCVANGKSILSILGACVRYQDEMEIICDGSDEQEALDQIIQLIESGLGDELDGTSND